MTLRYFRCNNTDNETQDKFKKLIL